MSVNDDVVESAGACGPMTAPFAAPSLLPFMASGTRLLVVTWVVGRG
jgi:hypothetical protein